MNNKSNWMFYDNMPKGALAERFEKPAGLDGAPELSLIRDLWMPASSILEIGAGEDRVIQGLIRRKYKKNIYAIERSNNFYKYLINKYKTFRNVYIWQVDLLKFDLPKADVGLWLWSGILEFSKDQQIYLVRKIRKNVSNLVIDTPHIMAKNNATFQNGQFAEIKTNWGVISAYLPSEDNIGLYAKKAGFNLKEVIRYKTKTGRDRLMYIL